MAGLLTGCASNVPSSGKDAIVPATDRFDAVISLAIQGELAGSISSLRTISNEMLSPKDATARVCMLERFGAPRIDSTVPDVPTAIASLVNAYQTYWHSQLMKTHNTESAQQQLIHALATLLNANGANVSSDTDLSTITDAVVPFVERHGMYALTGVTTPYAELMIWRVQGERRYPITLAEGSVDVTVAFLDDFVVSGWLHYATCGRRGTGGWAKTDKLFALKSRYDLASESFQVSYLSHEGQHFFDFKKFPELEQPELEYRAKLAELIAAKSEDYLRELLKNFASEAARDRAIAHPHAAYWLTQNLRKQMASVEQGIRSWNDVRTAPMPLIQTAAKALLLESSAVATRLGASATKTFLPN